MTSDLNIRETILNVFYLISLFVQGFVIYYFMHTYVWYNYILPDKSDVLLMLMPRHHSDSWALWLHLIYAFILSVFLILSTKRILKPFLYFLFLIAPISIYQCVDFEGIGIDLLFLLVSMMMCAAVFYLNRAKLSALGYDNDNHEVIDD